MALPHLHGNGAGEIAENSSYHTGVTPGSTAGKFIGFGEEGSSSIANRAHWALSENIDYLYQIVAADRAIPAGVSFTSIDQATYQIVDDVWCGDSGYPGFVGIFDDAHNEGMYILFSVLDENYNELTDVDGNEVRVHIVRDSTNTTEQYKDGFEQNPVITFKTIDSSGADVTNPYSIPAGQDVRILYGSKSNIETLPTDAFMKFNLQSASEVEAGAFLQDGTKKMTADADWDGHRILNLLEARGGAAADLLLRSQQDLNLQDQNLTLPVPFSQTGQAALIQPTSATHNPSVIGALNSNVQVSTLLVGNRPLNRTGSFVSSAVGPSVDYPDLDLLSNGEIIQIAAGTKDLSTLTPGQWAFVYYNPSTDLVEHVTSMTLLPAGSILVWSGQWSGAAWSNELDRRWPTHRQGTHEAWFVGAALGTDFTNLNDVTYAMYTGAAIDDHFKTREIVVVGSTTVTETFSLPTWWTLRGSGSSYSPADEIVTSATFDVNTNVIQAGAYCTIKGLQIEWANTSAHQASSKYGITTSTNCLIENVEFTDGTYSFWSCVEASYSWIRNCYMNGASYQAYAVDATGNCRVTDCELGPASFGDGLACARLSSTNNIIEHCEVLDEAPGQCFFYVTGEGNIIRDCYREINDPDTKPFVLLYDTEDIGLTLENNHLVNGYRFVSSTINNASRKVRVSARNNVLVDFTSTIFDFNNTSVSAESVLHIEGNQLQNNTAGYGIYVKDSQVVLIKNNKLIDVSTNGISLIGTRALVRGNDIKCAGYGISTDYANYAIFSDNIFDVDNQSILIDNSGYNVDMPAIISNNRFLDAAAGYSIIDIRGYSGTSITGNKFGTTGVTPGAAVWIQAAAGENTDNNVISNNMFMGIRGEGRGALYDAVVAIESGAGSTPSNNVVSDNSFDRCGNTTTFLRDGNIVFLDAYDSTVTGNTVTDPVGPANAATEFAVFFVLGGTTIVSNNVVVWDLTATGHPHGDIFVINIQDVKCTVNGNNLFLTGSGATSTTGNIRGIWLDTMDECVCNSNYVHDFDISTAASQGAIAGSGADCVVVGNLSSARNIDFGSMTPGMVLGNYIPSGGGSVFVATTATRVENQPQVLV